MKIVQITVEIFFNIPPYLSSPLIVSYYVKPLEINKYNYV